MVAQFSHHGMNPPDWFQSTAKERQKLAAIQAQIRELVVGVYPDETAWAEQIESQGLPVIRQAPEFQVKLTLTMAGAAPGLILPTFAKYDELVQSMLKLQPQLADRDFSHGMIVCIDSVYSFGFLTHQYYHWQCYQHGIAGYDAISRQLYDIFAKQYQSTLHPRLLKQLQRNQMEQLMIAIRRDREALEFVRTLMHEVFIPTNNGKLLSQGKAQA